MIKKKNMQFGVPLVSIGIPNHNYGGYIKDLLEIVASQTYRNIELIIVGDCSIVPHYLWSGRRFFL